MDKYKELFDLLKDIGIFSVAMWFIQNIISKSSDRKFEAYKKELDHKSREFQSSLDSKVELFKAELNLQNYKSTQIYEKQLAVIIELHKKLTRLNQAMKEMTAVMKLIISDADKEESDRISKATDAYNEFLTYYLENQIFLPQDAIDKLEKIKSDFFTSYNDYTFARRFGLKDKFSFEKSIEASERVSEKIQPAIDQLKLDFQQMIGVENKKN